jgi:uncharacterized protein (TIGR02246 family)
MPRGTKKSIAWMLALLVTAPALASAQTPPARPAPAGGAAANKAGAPKPAAPAKNPPAADAEEGLRQAIAAYARAVAEGDAAAIAKFWTADGDYAGPSGRVVNARKALESSSIDASGPHLTLKTETLRMITPDVAQEDGVSELKSEDDALLYRGHFAAIWVRQQGAWLLASLRETVAPPSSADRLGSLDWLVGQWEAEDKDNGATITISANWIDNKMYLLREIVVEREGRVRHRLTQRTAWDPLTRRIKSWTFGSNGDVGEGFWSHQGKDWVVHSTVTTRDGRSAAAKSTYSDISADSFVFTSHDTEVGLGKKSEVELRFRRLPDEP